VAVAESALEIIVTMVNTKKVSEKWVLGSFRKKLQLLRDRFRKKGW
jgi:hypothetical protein